MGRFTGFFQSNEEQEEIFPSPTVLEVFSSETVKEESELSSPETVLEKVEVFSPEENTQKRTKRTRK